MPRQRQPKSLRVALVLPTEYAYARAALRGIISATRERNLYDRSANSGGGAPPVPWLFNVFRGIYGHSTKFLSKWFKEWEPDGIIGQIYDNRLAKVYRSTGKPVVELFESRAHSEFPRVLPDDVALGRLAARHFLERGFRNFAFFGVPWMLWSREREAGFREEIERVLQGPPAASNDRRPRGGFTFSSFASLPATRAARRHVARGMASWMAELPKPVALLAANDLWGSELIQAARSLELHVPDDVAVLGVDNDELLCELSYPPLSSIRLGAEQVGRTAVGLLEQMMRGKKVKSEPARIPPMELVTRQSTDTLAVEDTEVAAALRHIRLHATEGISVKQLMEEVTMNRRTLERRFNSIVGHTPLEEIRRVRLERARVLLQTDLPIYQVALQSGFATPEYLATSFRQAEGVTPTAFRRRFGPRTQLGQIPPDLSI
jgi:LacI family transcriptional regulator